jgi:hypothetical protein
MKYIEHVLYRQIRLVSCSIIGRKEGVVVLFGKCRVVTSYIHSYSLFFRNCEILADFTVFYDLYVRGSCIQSAAC